MNKGKKFFFLLGILPVSTFAHSQWVARVRMEHPAIHTRHEQIYRKESLSPFTELICSWNIQNSENASIAVYVRVRCIGEKEWEPWHHMADWGGSRGNRSYWSHRGNSTYAHVRLVMDEGCFADAFEVKVDGASEKAIKQIVVSIANETHFSFECLGRYKQRPSYRVSSYPKISQMRISHKDAAIICSPTSLRMAMAGPGPEVAMLADTVYDIGLRSYGNWLFNIAGAYVLDPKKRSFAVVRFDSFQEILDNLAKRKPVVVSVRGHIPGAPKNYHDGHFLMIVGFDARRQRVICHDPAFSKHSLVLHTYSLPEFIRAWERSRRLAYIVS